MLDVFAQGHCVDVRVPIRGVIEFNVRDLGGEFAVADEIEIVALRVPGWIERIEHLIRYPADFPIRGAPNMDLRKAVSVRGHAEGEIVAARRPHIVANLITRCIDNLGHLSIGESYDKDLSILVAKGYPFAVGGPFRLITHGAAAVGNLLRRLRTVLRNQIELLFAAHV